MRTYIRLYWSASHVISTEPMMSVLQLPKQFNSKSIGFHVLQSLQLKLSIRKENTCDA